MNAKVERDAAHVMAVTAKLNGPQKVHVLLLDRYEAGDSDIEGIFASKESADSAACALIEDWFQEDRIDEETRDTLLADWKAGTRAELPEDRKLECYEWDVTP